MCNEGGIFCTSKKDTHFLGDKLWKKELYHRIKDLIVVGKGCEEVFKTVSVGTMAKQNVGSVSY